MSNFEDEIWDKLEPVPGVNPSIWKKDFAGAWIRKDLFETERLFGWVITTKFPENFPNNSLIPVHWINAKNKGNKTIFETIISSNDETNIKIIKKWEIKDNEIKQI